MPRAQFVSQPPAHHRVRTPRLSVALIATGFWLGACSNDSGSPASGLTMLQAPVPQVASAKPSAAEPPGPYWVEGKLCGEDDCDNIPGRWRATAPVSVYAQPDAAAPVVARIATDEWVKAVEKRTRFIPQRGVVRTAAAGLSVGAIVYGPFAGAGADDEHAQVWHDGKRVTIPTQSGAPEIAWEPMRQNVPMRTMWVRVERTGGAGGWLKDPMNFACMGENRPSDEHC